MPTQEVFNSMLQERERYDLVDFLYSYYDNVIYKIYEKTEDDLDDDDEAFPKELTLPLEQREYPIREQLLALLDAGYDLNAPCGEDDYPLMRAVGFLDAPMTEFMIAHGADPFLYPNPSDPCRGNYYFDDLDIHAMNESFVTDANRDVFDAILRVAVVLGRAGVRGNGHCLTIDDDSVSLEQAKAKF